SFPSTLDPSLKRLVTDAALPITIPFVNYWIVKQEPEDYSWANLTKDRCTAWTGVRNFQARNNRSEERRVGKGGRARWMPYQAEDGIRDLTVTGVQTCALPI